VDRPKVKHELEIAYGSRYGIEEAAALMEVLRANAPSCGTKVKQFEEAFAAYCGVKHALAVTSATTGLTLAGIAAGVGPDTEVITTPVTWVASAFAFSTLGARLVFCDVDPRTLNLDPAKLETLITPKTRAIVPVHLAGQCCAWTGSWRSRADTGSPSSRTARTTPGARTADGSRAASATSGCSASTSRRTWAPSARAAW